MGGEIYELPSEKLTREVTAKVTAEVTEKFCKQLEDKEKIIAKMAVEIAELKNNNKPA